MRDEVLTQAQASQIRVAASVLLDLWRDGYIDWKVTGTPDLGELSVQLSSFVSTYRGVGKA